MKTSLVNTALFSLALVQNGDATRPRPKKSLSEKLQDSITTDGLMENLRRLDEIATANGGNRAFGLPGYDASRDFILERVGGSGKFKSWTQDFPALYNNVESITFRVDDVEYYVFGPT